MEEKKDIATNPPTTELPKKKSKAKIVVILLIIVLLLMGCLLLYMYFNNNRLQNILDDKVKSEEGVLTSAKERSINEYGLRLEKADLENYIKTNSYLSITELMSIVGETDVKCSESEAYKDGTVYLNGCTIDGVGTHTSYGVKQEEPITEAAPIVEGTTVTVYETKGQYGSKLSLIKPVNMENVVTHKLDIDVGYNTQSSISIIDNKYLSYLDKNQLAQLYDIVKNQKAAPNEDYSGIYLYKMDESYYSYNYAAIYKNNKYYLYSLKDNKYISDVSYDTLSPYINGCGTTGPAEYLNTLKGNNIAVIKDKKYGVVDITNGKEIIPIKYTGFLRQDKLLIARENKKGVLYSLDGKEILNNVKIDNIFAVSNNAYVFALVDDHVKLLLINGNELYDFGEYTVDHLHIMSSSIDTITAQIAETSDSRDCITFKYDMSTGKGTSEKQMCSGISKPILYFYPEKDINVKVTFDDPSVLETTYPKYNNGWEVTAKKDGSLYDKKGNYYYALYWDEEKIHTADFKEGFYVTKDNAIDFLEEKLSYIGLNDKERNEFIMYWLPILEKNKKSLVYFELTEERNSYSKININPKPDSTLRIVIHIKKVNKKPKIKEEILIPFERRGFTVVEWGGTTY